MNRLFQALLRGAALASLAGLASCFDFATRDPAADQVRGELNQLEADPQLAGRAPIALQEAEVAVSAAETSQHDPAYSAHLVYLAERKVQTARALAVARVAEDQVQALRPQ